MPSSSDFLNKILEKLSGLDDVSCRKMMGEYLLYYKGVVVGGIYDDRLLVKPVESAREIFPNADLELPYPGAKSMLRIEELDEADRLQLLIKSIFLEISRS